MANTLKINLISKCRSVTLEYYILISKQSCNDLIWDALNIGSLVNSLNYAFASFYEFSHLCIHFPVFLKNTYLRIRKTWGLKGVEGEIEGIELVPATGLPCLQWPSIRQGQWLGQGTELRSSMWTQLLQCSRLLCRVCNSRKRIKEYALESNPGILVCNMDILTGKLNAYLTSESL